MEDDRWTKNLILALEDQMGSYADGSLEKVRSPVSRKNCSPVAPQLLPRAWKAAATWGRPQSLSANIRPKQLLQNIVAEILLLRLGSRPGGGPLNGRGWDGSTPPSGFCCFSGPSRGPLSTPSNRISAGVVQPLLDGLQ